MRLYTLLALGLVSTSQVLAAGVTIEPGLWELTTTRSSFKGGEGPITETEQTCIKESEYDPVNMFKDLPEDCEPIQQQVDGNSLTFSLTCMAEGAEQKISGKFTSGGTTAEGRTDIEMNFMGQKLSMNSEFTGKRLGDCVE